MTTYTFIAEDSRGQVIREGSISAGTKKGARVQFWNGLTEQEQGACSSIECVDEVHDEASLDGSAWTEPNGSIPSARN